MSSLTACAKCGLGIRPEHERQDADGRTVHAGYCPADEPRGAGRREAMASDEQLARLTSALEFYADPELYTPDSPDGLCPAEDDRGERARSALASAPPPR